MFFVLACLSYIIQHSFGYNLVTELPIIRKGENGSYFGFSVATYSFFDSYGDLDSQGRKRNYSWLLVGAPKGNTTELQDLGVTNPGVVMRCDFKNELGCSALPFETEGDTSTEIKSNGWLGVSVLSAGYNGAVWACSHRLLVKAGNFYTYPGKCYKSTDLGSSVDPSNFFKDPLDYCATQNQNKLTAGSKDTISYKGHQYCQMGVSLSHIVEPGVSEPYLLVGAPGGKELPRRSLVHSRRCSRKGFDED
ncbi:integrin alpha-7-like [Montipora capricornis]|uniref:integrin alpha-7-like n=1 Tax=Montipora capricornis TaxID=246305 RepID=UPI0035F1BA13